MKTIITLLVLTTLLLSKEYFYYHKGEKVPLTPSFETANTRSTAEAMTFKKNSGQNITITKNVIAKLRDISPEEVAKKYGVRFIEKLTPTLFFFETNSPTQALELSNSLTESHEADFAHPDIIQKIERR